MRRPTAVINHLVANTATTNAQQQVLLKVIIEYILRISPLVAENVTRGLQQSRVWTYIKGPILVKSLIFVTGKIVVGNLLVPILFKKSLEHI